MRTLLGPPVPPSLVVGRDELIARLWDMLDRQSVLLTAERRIGKTSIIKKMQHESSGRLAFFRDVGGLRSPAEFADAVFQDVEGHLKLRSRAASKVRELLHHLGGTEFQGVRLPEIANSHWKEILRRSVEDLTYQIDRPVVFFWDEVPWMLGTIAKEHGESVAMELLDVLRALRQTHSDSLRMVFTGSIGLHHVLTDLQGESYQNTPVNDIYPFEVPPLSPKYGQELALLLLKGESIKCEDLPAVAESISSGVGSIPFYIHHMVDILKNRPGIQNNSDVREALAAAIADPNDPWGLSHFAERLNGYYKTQATLAGELLDVLAIETEPLKPSVVEERMPNRSAVSSGEIRDLLKLLARDHYLERRHDGTYAFRYEILRRWWVLERDL